MVRKVKLEVEIPDSLMRKINKKREENGFGDKSIADWFQWLTKDIRTKEDLREEVHADTRINMLPIWLRNFAENLDYIRYGDGVNVQIPENYKPHNFSELAEPMPLLEPEPEFSSCDAPIVEYKGLKIKNPPKGSAVIIGRGPSVFNHKHLEVLSDAVHKGDYSGLICATDGMLIHCLEYDLVPDITLTVDGSSVIKKWYDHPLVEKYGSKIKAIFLVSVHNSVYQVARKNGVKVYWAIPAMDDWRDSESWSKMHRLMCTTEKYKDLMPMIQPGGNAGTCLWAAVVSLFKRAPAALIGFDMGYPEGTKLEDTYYYSTMLKGVKEQFNGDISVLKGMYREFYHPVFKQKAYVDLVFYSYRTALIDMQKQCYPWYKVYGGTINASEGGSLWGPGITCMSLKSFLDQYHK